MNTNVAVVGCGYWGKNLVRVLSELDALKCLCDTDVTRRDALPFALVAGVPARQIGSMCRCAGQRLEFDSSGSARCSACNRGFRLHDGMVQELHDDVDRLSHAGEA